MADGSRVTMFDAVNLTSVRAVEPLIAEDGSITFETNVFIYVVGQA